MYQRRLMATLLQQGMFFLNISFSLFTLTTYLTSRSLELKVTTGDIFQPMVCNLAQLTFIGYNLAAKNAAFFDASQSALIDYKRLQGIPMTDSLLVRRVHGHPLRVMKVNCKLRKVPMK